MDLGAQVRRELGRELSLLAGASVRQVLAINQVETPSAAWRIGFTGPPGVGKSTLVGRFVERRAATTDGVAVLAIDPASPLSGGALLGDRIRMDAAVSSPGVYLRSVSSRAAGDGLCDNAAELLLALERRGFAEVVVETVGVGQAEHAVRILVDTLVVLIQPDSGDAVQALKAGTLEVADIIVIAKGDLPGAVLAREQIAATLALARSHDHGGGGGDGWQVPVLTVSARSGEGFAALEQACAGHRDWLARHVDADAVALRRSRYRLRELLQRACAEVTRDLDARDIAGAYAASVARLTEQE